MVPLEGKGFDQQVGQALLVIHYEQPRRGPVAPERHEWLIGLMEGVEDIPGAALSAGIEWGWESFPEFLDALDARSHVMDLGTQVPHGAVRGYVMGERGARNEPAAPEDIEAMAAIVREGIEAAALGFSTSRTLAHRAIDGEPVPGTFAAEDELFGIGRVLGELGTGVFELAPAGALGEDLAAPEREMDWETEPGWERLTGSIRLWRVPDQPMQLKAMLQDSKRGC